MAVSVQDSPNAFEDHLPDSSRSSSGIKFVTDTQHTIARELFTISQMTHDEHSFNPSEWHRQHTHDLGLLHGAKADLEPVLIRLGSQSDEYLKHFKILQVKLQMITDKHKVC
jgi:hypothetical protein